MAGSIFFFRLDDKTEVFVKADSERYTKETLGIHDNIDLPFVSDEAVMGEWDSVTFVSEIGVFSPDRTRFGQLYGEGKSKNITGRGFMRRMVSLNLFMRSA